MAHTHTHTEEVTQGNPMIYYRDSKTRVHGSNCKSNQVKKLSCVQASSGPTLRDKKDTEKGTGNKMTMVSFLPSLLVCFCYPFNHSEKEQTALHASPRQRSTSPSTNDGEKATDDWEAMSEVKQKDPAVGFFFFFFFANIASSFTKHCAKESNESCMHRQLTFKSHIHCRLRTN